MQEGELGNFTDWYQDFNMFSGGKYPDMFTCNYVNAEFIKYANNAFLATKISFINDLAGLCEKIPGANISRIARAMGMDKRISEHFSKDAINYTMIGLKKGQTQLSK